MLATLKQSDSQPPDSQHREYRIQTLIHQHIHSTHNKKLRDVIKSQYLKHIGHFLPLSEQHADKEDAICEVKVSIKTGPLDKYR